MSISSLESFSDIDEKKSNNKSKKSLNKQNNNSKTNKNKIQHDDVWDFINTSLNNASNKKRKITECPKPSLNNLTRIVNSYNVTN